MNIVLIQEHQYLYLWLFDSWFLFLLPIVLFCYYINIKCQKIGIGYNDYKIIIQNWVISGPNVSTNPLFYFCLFYFNIIFKMVLLNKICLLLLYINLQLTANDCIHFVTSNICAKIQCFYTNVGIWFQNPITIFQVMGLTNINLGYFL